MICPAYGGWAAYKAFGRNPGRYRINSVVDVNNLISVKSGFSVGSYDLGEYMALLFFVKQKKERAIQA